MLMILSPSKNMEMGNVFEGVPDSTAQFQKDAERLMTKLKALGANSLSKLMALSPAMTEKTLNTIASWGEINSLSSPAVLSYTGEAFKGLNARSFSKEDMRYANDHLRILSGLYGVLRPLDLIQPYRLEMGLNWKQGKEGNLYALWKEKITGHLKATLDKQDRAVLLNLASTEYFKAIDTKTLDIPIVHFKFLDWKNGAYKQIMTFTKQARGALAGEIIRARVDSIDAIKTLIFSGYYFDKEASTEGEMIFIRKG